jgi:hypothetical protein
MHLYSEILSLMCFPLLPPLAIVIVVIVHLMIITSPALPFCARLNPATLSPQSQWQIVSFWGVLVGARNWDPLVKSHPLSTFDCCLFAIRGFWCNSLAPSARIAAPQRGCRGGPHYDASPSPGDRHPCRLPLPLAWLLLLLPPVLFLPCWAMAVCYVADDQCRRMQGKVFPIRGRCCPRPGARLPAPPGTWRPTVRWGCQGGGTRQWSWHHKAKYGDV